MLLKIKIPTTIECKHKTPSTFKKRKALHTIPSVSNLFKEVFTTYFEKKNRHKPFGFYLVQIPPPPSFRHHISFFIHSWPVVMHP